ncbi:MAG: ATP synthase F1 subunit gamma [Phycisphaerales bacterium]|nr:ATP synthase F1 subunit gamma [Phycisphaerales bacterium]
MGNARDIKKRMKAVGNIKRITRTMQMIATSKFAKAQQASLASRPYTDTLFGLVAQLADAGVGEGHALLTKPSADSNELTLMISADRGLCGPYNGTMVRTTLKHLKSDPSAANGMIEVVGKKGAGALKFNGYTDFTHHTHIGDKPAYEDVERLADRFMQMFVDGEVSAVRVVYMKYYSAGRQRPEILQLLPFSAPEVEAGEDTSSMSDVYEFSPDADSLLDSLLPAAVKAVLYQCFNDAVVSEHIARMVAMKAATDNAGKMGGLLKREFNRVRQTQITTELTEIISGAAALE